MECFQWSLLDPSAIKNVSRYFASRNLGAFSVSLMGNLSDGGFLSWVKPEWELRMKRKQSPSFTSSNAYHSNTACCTKLVWLCIYLHTYASVCLLEFLVWALRGNPILGPKGKPALVISEFCIFTVIKASHKGRKMSQWSTNVHNLSVICMYSPPFNLHNHIVRSSPALQTKGDFLSAIQTECQR